MNAELTATPPLPFAAALSRAETFARPGFARRALAALWKLGIGMWFCQSLGGAVLVVGWTYRLVQRSALKFWWRRSPAGRGGETFENFVAGHDATRGHRHWPNWIVEQNISATLRRRDGEARGGHLRRVAQALGVSLWRNLRIGLQGFANSTLLLLPGSSLMLFSWYAGWHNSFNKGYEQYSVGLTLGISGIVLWIVAMLYVPLAQARQAITGEWRAFYDFRFIWRLARAQWAGCVALAGLFSAAMLPVTIVRLAPNIAPQAGLKVESMTNAQLVEFLNGVFFWSALWLLPAFVLVRLAAGRLYATGILRGVASGRITPAELGAFERAALERLDLHRAAPQPRRHVLVRVATKTSRFMVRPAAIFTAALVWFSVVAQLYVQQFFNYIPAAHGWLNHPLAQAPTIRFIPPHLQGAPLGP